MKHTNNHKRGVRGRPEKDLDPREEVEKGHELMSKINLDDKPCNVEVDVNVNVNVERRQIGDDGGKNDEAITTAYNQEQSQKAMSMMMLTVMSENYKNNDGDAFDNESND